MFFLFITKASFQFDFFRSFIILLANYNLLIYFGEMLGYVVTTTCV